ELRGEAIKVQGQFCQVVGIVPEGALASAGNGDFLKELLVKLMKTCYLGTSSLDKVKLFFFI
ncbi:hypothetical protein, partial [Pontibacter qinzhouensis]|uniref:hypothetical protein n=1 Tax=Pontibacter qinzhouensis TaxID=2603253 RepID=UPI001C9BC892